MTDGVLQRIVSRGYWRVTMHPSVFKQDRIADLYECQKLMEDCKVVLRGWDYPHSDRILSGEDYLWSETDWEIYKIYWRFYRSAQFVHYFGCVEDWWRESTLDAELGKRYGPGEVLEIIMVLYDLTEIYEFASRLAQKGIFDEQMNMSIELHGVRGRKLTALNRILFPIEYECMEAELLFEKMFSVQDLVARTSELSLEHALWVFERFNWRHIRSPEIVANLREDQKKLLERRL
jgi:hypothetical protein